MAKRFRRVQDPTQIIVDKESGEVLRAVTKVVCETQEEFVKIYLNAIDELVKLDRRMIQILMLCLKEAKFCDEQHVEGNVVYNYAEFKNKCRQLPRKPEENELSDDAINTYMSRLASQKLLLRKSRGVFILNPRYFAKGKITPKTRMELIVQYEGN